MKLNIKHYGLVEGGEVLCARFGAPFIAKRKMLLVWEVQEHIRFWDNIVTDTVGKAQVARLKRAEVVPVYIVMKKSKRAPRPQITAGH
jgi:hypothetical protein